MTREREINKAAQEYAFTTPSTIVASFEEGAKWADKTMIAKACEWLYEYCRYGCCEYIEKNDFIEDFRKAMEE